MTGLFSSMRSGYLLFAGSDPGTLKRPILYSRQITWAFLWKNNLMYHTSSPFCLSFRLISFEPSGRLLVSIPICNRTVASDTRRLRFTEDVSVDGKLPIQRPTHLQ